MYSTRFAVQYRLNRSFLSDRFLVFGFWCCTWFAVKVKVNVKVKVTIKVQVKVKAKANIKIKVKVKV